MHTCVKRQRHWRIRFDGSTKNSSMLAVFQSLHSLRCSSSRSEFRASSSRRGRQRRQWDRVPASGYTRVPSDNWTSGIQQSTTDKTASHKFTVLLELVCQRNPHTQLDLQRPPLFSVWQCARTMKQRTPVEQMMWSAVLPPFSGIPIRLS